MASFVAAVLALAFILPVMEGAAPEGRGPAATEAAAPARLMTIYQSPWCGCCGEYARYLEERGFRVEVVLTADPASVKRELGVPERLWSCHTGVIDGYVVEGHVPVEAIEALLEGRPDVDGIAVPGMPAGAPGMGGPPEPLTVYWFRGGEVGVFMVVEPAQ